MFSALCQISMGSQRGDFHGINSRLEFQGRFKGLFNPLFNSFPWISGFLDLPTRSPSCPEGKVRKRSLEGFCPEKISREKLQITRAGDRGSNSLQLRVLELLVLQMEMWMGHREELRIKS